MKNKLQYTLIASVLGLGLMSCQDEWDSHYGQTAATDYGTASLYEVLKSQPELSDFCQVLAATKSFANNKQTEVTYAQLLDADQFFTVWAPVNGTFNRDELLNMTKTVEGDSLVELHFIKNHVARYSHSSNGKDRSVMMLNGKTLAYADGGFANVTLDKKNIAARNGLVHTIKEPISYYYNIYEALVAQEQYQHIGSFLRKYHVDVFDPTSSLAMGIKDGKTVYVDSIFYTQNELLYFHYGHIDREDSTYWMIVPTKELWDELYADAETYYDYGAIEKADSIHDRWAHYALMQDLVFNPNAQTSIKDSIVSTTFSKYQDGIYHTYYKPFQEGGLFTTAWSAEQQCSNGMIYEVSKWPFQKNFTFFTPIAVEAEDRVYKYEEPGNKKLSLIGYRSSADSISQGYVVATPEVQTDAYFIEYELPDVLSGKYDVCVVMLPRSVDPMLPFTEESLAGRRNRRPAKFTAEIFYNDKNGKAVSVASNGRYTYDPENPAHYIKGGNNDKTIDFLFDCNYNADKYASRAFTNDPFKVDTVKLCTMHFPTCNFDQRVITNRLRITNKIGNSDTEYYWCTMFIDRILLLPHNDEAEN